MAIQLTTRIARVDGMMSAPIDKEIVILNMAGNNYVSLDATGRRIWDLLGTPMRVEDLCLQLQQEFEGDTQQISADVLSFLAKMENEGLVRVVEE